MSRRVRTRAGRGRDKGRAGRQASTLRLIGGAWRGRRVAIADAPGLRPTPDRVRETLFNWLAPRIEGARCIDLFAGTGALGLEALSRGAAHVQFVERDRAAVTAIRSALATLGAAERAAIVQTDALMLPPGGANADIVFIDPPFNADLHVAALAAISVRLAPHARIYLEYPAEQQTEIAAALSRDHAILNARQAGRVGYCLAQPTPASQYNEP